MPEKELNPSPAIVHGEYPELSPNPKDEGLVKKDGGRETPVEINTRPAKRPVVFEDVVLDNLAVKDSLKIKGMGIDAYIQSQSSNIKFELIADLGNIHVGEEEGVYIAYLSKEFELPDYDLYIFAMNGSFIITPLTTKANNTRLALSCGSFAYDESGNTMVARVRFVATYNGDPSSFRIGFDANFAEALYGSEITPKGYIFGIKL